MKNIFRNIMLCIGLFTLILSSCKEVDPIIDSLTYDRVFTPIGLEVRIRNKTTAEFTWTIKNDADYYVLEISEGIMDFGTIVKTATIHPDEIPYQVTLDGETQYSARLKGMSDTGTGDSKWTMASFKTDPENIFTAVAGEDIKATSVTLRWPAGSEVTHFKISPGDVQRNISDPEKAAGVATITGLTGETDYTVTLYKGTKQRGQVSFTTLIDIGDATAVHPEDDLNAVIAAADPGDVLVLFPGNYTTFRGDLSLDKSITIKGLLPYNKPVINIRFVLNSGVGDFMIKDVELVGTYDDGSQTILSQAIQCNSGTYDINSIIIEGSIVRDYNQALIYGGSAKLKLQTLTINDCVMSNIVNDGGDFIDFRSGHVSNLSVTNSTFNKVAARPRDFIRMDAASGISGTGLTCNILIDHCTFYSVSNSRRILYVRFVSNASTVTNNIFAGPEGYTGYYSNQAATTDPACSNNNYFNAPAFYTGSLKLDKSSSYTTLDPGFINAESGDFKITNQALIDNNIGDPRWR